VGISGVILLSPPLRFTTAQELLRWNGTGVPVHALIPELDDYLVPEKAIERFSEASDVIIEPVEGAKHLWVGEKFVYTVLNRITELVSPNFAPLPNDWPESQGPMEHWNDLK
jgi:hypothetical protein